MHDADGLATSLIEEVRAWTWGPLERRCDGWVAEEVSGYAEEVHKLAAALRNGNRPLAAVQRSLLAVHLAPVVAVHRRILYGSENQLWDLVSGAMGEGRHELQSAALGLGGEGFERTCAAALGLYGLAGRGGLTRARWAAESGGGAGPRARSVGQLVDGQRGQGQGGQYLDQGEAEYRRGLGPGGAREHHVHGYYEAEAYAKPQEGFDPVPFPALAPDRHPDERRDKESQDQGHQPQQRNTDVQKVFHGASLHQRLRGTGNLPAPYVR
jgi:hypothetical protein